MTKENSDKKKHRMLGETLGAKTVLCCATILSPTQANSNDTDQENISLPLKSVGFETI